MCGIVGIAGRPPVSLKEVSEAMGRLRHRGPDAEQTRLLCTDRIAVALGHTRLKIIDLSPAADQPMPNEDGSVWVAYNGEIYNFPELRADLVSSGHIFRSRTDTEVLVHLYEDVHGDVPRMLDRLRGMFAFALIDLGRGVVALARDRLGVKPMYWHHRNGRLVFASEVRGVVGTGVVPAEPDLQSMASYVGWGVVPGPRTAILGVQELPPGHFLVWSPDTGATTARWWWPTLEHRELTKDDAVAELRVTLTDSVKRHLLADRPVGIFLSGGVDSGAVVQIASAMGEVRALTVVFPGEHHEGASASAIAHQAGAIHDCVEVSGAEVSRHLPDILGAMDQPTADGLNTWIVCRAARQAGLTVALSGLGGDELFGGYPGFRLIPEVMRLGRFAKVLPIAARRSLAGTLSMRNPGGRLARIVGSSEGPMGAYFAVRGLFPQTELRVDSNWTPLYGGDTSLVNVCDSGQLDLRDVVMVMESQHYLANQLLRDTDQMSMAHSLEVRVPLLDDDVVRLAWSMPPSTRNSRHKALLAQAAGVAEGSRKLGFTLPMDKWIRGPLNDSVREGLLSAELPFGDLITPEFRKRLWEQFEAGRTHWSRPWAIAVLRLWPGAQALGW